MNPIHRFFLRLKHVAMTLGGSNEQLSILGSLIADEVRSGVPVEDILSRSDLYERERKNPHAFCTDIDRKGDIRILANIIDNTGWMDTMLHELGHAVYDKYIARELPFLLRRFPHLCTTEASAMFFGRLSHDPLWMKAALDLSDEEEIGRAHV